MYYFDLPPPAMPTQHHRSTVTVPTRTPSPTSHTTFKPWNNVHWNMNNVVLKKTIKCLLLEYMYNTHIFIWSICKICDVNPTWKLDPVGSTVRYEMMKLCTGSVWYSKCCYLVVLSRYKVALDNSWWHWVRKGHLCLHLLKQDKVNTADFAFIFLIILLISQNK